MNPARARSSLARWLLLIFVLILASVVLLGCRRSRPDAVEVEPTATAVVQMVEVTRVVEVTPQPWTQPHPLLGDVRVRKAIAHCIDRDALLAAVYPFLSEDARANLRIDSFLPNEHWAYNGPYPDLPFDPDLGGSLLVEAGWALPAGDLYRRNAAGDVLTLKLSTSDARFRQDWAAVAEENLRECGVQLLRLHTPASWWLGADTGLQRRDFELGAYAESSQVDPGGRSRYACDQVPLPGNGWQGENYSGWCNPAADRAVIATASAPDRATQASEYDIVQRQFAADVPALPLFRRAEAEAWTPRLAGVRPNSTEFSTAFIAEWEAADGEPLRIGLLDEPDTMLIDGEPSPSQRQIAQIGIGSLWTQADYDFQPRTQTPLATIENGLVTRQMVEVSAGDRVFTTFGIAETIGAGASALSLPQFTVTYQFEDFVWSDGTTASPLDIELAHRFACRTQADAVRPAVCDAIQDVSFGPGMQATVTYLPGYDSPSPRACTLGRAVPQPSGGE